MFLKVDGRIFSRMHRAQKIKLFLIVRMKVFVKKFGKTSFLSTFERLNYFEFIVAVERLNKVVAKTALISENNSALELLRV